MRLVDLHFHFLALARGALHRGLVDEVAALAGGLRRVHGDVGVAHQLLDAVVRRGERHADARRDAHVRAGQVERFLQRLDDPPGDLHHLLPGAEILEQHGELVAAEARDGVAAAGRLDEPLRALVQHAVADRMAEGIVDVLEVVEVDEHDGYRPPVALADRHRVLDAVAEQRAVPEQGQRVVQRHSLQLLFHALAVGHVAEVQQAPADRRFAVHVGAVDLDDALALVPARDAGLDDAGSARPREVAGDELAQPRAIVEHHEFVEVLADQVLRREAEDPLRGRRHVVDGAIRGDDRDDVRRVADQRVEARLGRARCEAGLDRHREGGHDRLPREQQARGDADHPGDQAGGLAEAAAVQDEQRVTGEHQRGVGRQRGDRGAALGRVHRRRAPLGAQVIEVRRHGEGRDRADMQRHRVRRDVAERGCVGLEQAGADQRTEGQRKGDMRRPVLPVRAAQQQDRGQHADHGVEAERPGAACGQQPGREVMRQGEPEHAADAQRDERRLEPELRPEGPAAGGEQEAGRGHGDAGEEGELEHAHRRLHGREIDRARDRDEERRQELQHERPGEPRPGPAAFGSSGLRARRPAG